ncbi:uncharacterized protein LOC111872608 [Cryptotermes secundus]|uniref:uncharacterized protein LOC111872608 n=1 Tax=Cryptotermes secundus TaxID=105785 RepID=UPI000CD7ADA6|nr:uncharacterized protein LOC111872608 [Cryptotermes secundus]
MSQTIIETTRTFRLGTVPRTKGSYLASPLGACQIAQTVLGAVCVGLVGYYGNQYYYDTAIQAAEWATLVLKHLVKIEHADLAKPVTFFLIAACACLINTLCFLTACTLSPITALMITKTAYSVLYHFVAFALYLSASVTLIVSISREDIRNYRDGHYYEPFMAAGIIGVIVAACYLLSIAVSYRSHAPDV